MGHLGSRPAEGKETLTFGGACSIALSMRSARIKAAGTAVYHCQSRLRAHVGYFDEEAMSYLRKVIWDVAFFAGVEVLAFSVLPTQFHVLVRVPEKRECTVDELIARYSAIYRERQPAGFPEPAQMRAILEGEDRELAAAWVERLTVRMHDVSFYMKTVKQYMTVWFNKRNWRVGTIWYARFESEIVEDTPENLRTVAAFVDLAPVRSGLVEDPAEYAWSSYAEALAGNPTTGTGLATLLGEVDSKE